MSEIDEKFYKFDPFEDENELPSNIKFRGSLAQSVSDREVSHCSRAHSLNFTAVETLSLQNQVSFSLKLLRRRISPISGSSKSELLLNGKIFNLRKGTVLVRYA